MDRRTFLRTSALAAASAAIGLPRVDAQDAGGKPLPLAPEPPRVQGAGDLVAFRSAGAYGAVMASEYNTRPMIPEVLVHGDQFAVIRARPTFDEIIERDIIPPWL